MTKDFAEATKWFRKAAGQGSAQAENNLGACYANGYGVPVSFVEAAIWYKKAASQGEESAQEWIRKQADQGNADIQLEIGLFYYFGTGVAKDYVKAVKWVRKSANQGNANAQNYLGVMYAGGQGLPQDYVKAYEWYNLAAGQGITVAVENRDGIARLLSPEQVAEGQRLSREFVPRKQSGSEHSNAPNSPTASGTGFFITDDGYLITNNHVVKNAQKIRVATSAGLISANIVKVDTANDLALLKAEGRFAPLPIVASRAVKLGGTVATVGFPDIGLQGFAPKFARGEIASLSGASDDARYFQISVPVQPGNSGGALVDEHGNVVGVVSAKLDAAMAYATSGALPENVNYAVKSSFLLSFLESVPEVSAKLKEPITTERKFDDVVKSAQDAAVLVLVY